jgi:hypothetical protein
MANFMAFKSYFDKEKLHYLSFHPKLEKPIKAVIFHLPKDTLAKCLHHDGWPGLQHYHCQANDNHTSIS